PMVMVAMLYPTTCVLCQAPGHDNLDLCTSCNVELPYIKHCCAICSQPLPEIIQPGTLCGSCQHHLPAFDHCIAVLEYTKIVSHLIKGFKFNHNLAYGRLLGNLLANKLASAWEQRYLMQPTNLRPECIIPVPLHFRRLRERGFNQAQELAIMASKRLTLPIDNVGCVRIHNTTPQPGLTAKERSKNLNGAFRIRHPFPACVAIVDDVMTSKATTNELAKTLKKSGVQRVEVWIVARVNS
ncbi:hypothetical protein TI03_06345, partial [Achromatium sp. WMS1]